MTKLLSISDAIDRFNKMMGIIAAWMVLLAVLVSALNAGSRYAFSISSNAWLELQWYMFSAMFLLGSAYTLYKREHVRVDVVYSSVGNRGRLWIDTIGFIFFFFPMVIIIGVMSWPYLKTAWVTGETSMHAGGLTRWPVWALLPIGMAFLALQGVSELIKRVAALMGVQELDLTYEKPLQ
ncbi:MAG: TRAP transporter small permease subunit [Alphaproteobacteria bacterium]|jgi:TRAP-type mannitol/chloroaromatic compound transport system permease small subunit